jgi:hypothetical protein
LTPIETGKGSEEALPFVRGREVKVSFVGMSRTLTKITSVAREEVAWFIFFRMSITPYCHLFLISTVQEKYPSWATIKGIKQHLPHM